MNYYNEIKNELINNEIIKKVKNYSINSSDLKTKYKVGKLLSEAGKHYGEGIIKEYSIKLTEELGSGYSVTELKYIRRFYIIFEKSPALPDQLSWSHYRELMSLKDNDEIEYYVNITIQRSLSYRRLHNLIKSKEYERLSNISKNRLVKGNIAIKENIPNPILIRNKNNIDVITEKVLQSMILEDVAYFLESLGSGYTFIKNEYPIKLGNRYNYIDILLFNYEFNCFVVVELKIGELKKEHLGQIEIYMNYIDTNLKKCNHDRTIGLIISREANEYIVRYSSDKRIISRVYELI